MKTAALKRLTTKIEQGWSPDADGEPASTDEVGVLRLDAVHGGRVHVEVNKRVPDPGALRADWRRFVVGDGDLLITRASGSLNRLGLVGLARIPSGVIRLFPDLIYRIRPKDRGTDSRFLAYVLGSAFAISQYRAMTRGAANNKLRIEDVANVRIPERQLGTQVRVVDFLDRECERIATLDRLLRRMTENTAEAAIANARDLVGFGRYAAVQIRYVANPGTGHTPSRSHPDWWIPEECMIPWFTLADVHQLRKGGVDYVTHTSERISEVGLANSSAVRHPASTVLLSRTASVGFAAIMATEMAVSQDFMTWTCGPRLEPTFLLHALRASRPELLGMMHGSTHKTIYMPDLLALRVPLPPLAVQRDVAAKVDRLSASRRGLTLKTAAMRTKLAEYRDALITEAVTGQLNVTAASDAQMDERMHEAVESASA